LYLVYEEHIKLEIFVNNQTDALFSSIYLFISSLYTFRASSVHYQEIELY